MRATGAKTWLRWLMPALLVTGLIAFFALGLQRYVTVQSLAANRHWLLEAVARHRVIAVIGFIATYALADALSVPGGAILTISGGFLFGLAPGTIYSVIGATIGTTILFVAAKSTIGESLRARAGSFIGKLESGFREDALNYLLFLRLVPIFPFWLVNLVPAFLGMRLRSFIIATAIGVIPGALVYAAIGNGLGALLQQAKEPDLAIVFRPTILFPLLGLATLALVPVIYKRLHQRRDRKEKGHG